MDSDGFRWVLMGSDELRPNFFSPGRSGCPHSCAPNSLTRLPKPDICPMHWSSLGQLKFEAHLVPIGVATSTALPTTSMPSSPMPMLGCCSLSSASKESARVTESMNGEESGVRLRSSSFPPFVILQKQPFSSLQSDLFTCRLHLIRAS